MRLFGKFFYLFSDLTCLVSCRDSLKSQVLRVNSSQGKCPKVFEGVESIYVVKKINLKNINQ